MPIDLEPVYLSTATVARLIPEMVLIATAAFIYLGGAFFPKRGGWSWIALASVAVAAFALARGPAPAGEFGPIISDVFAFYIRWLVLTVGAVFVLIASRPSRWGQPAEFMGTLLVILAGLMLVAGASELILLFLGLELVTIPTYILLYLGRDDAGSQEASVKYFFLSVLSAALLLYGFSFLYGVAGSTQLADIQRALTTQGDVELDPTSGLSRLAGVALLLVIAGLGFKATAVPFHFYAPDVYQGTTNLNAGLLAVAPKIAGFVALVRIVVVAMPDVNSLAWRVAFILALVTMTLGNVLALWQDNVRRLLAYSSIAHGGYMLIGLAAGLAMAGVERADGAAVTTEALGGVGAMLFYLAVYAFATAGAFAALVYLGGREGELNRVDELAGLGRTHPLAAGALAIFMFSLAGIPPLAGFWGKFTLFSSALSVDGGDGAMSRLALWFAALAVVGVINAAIAAAYYLRIVATMYFRDSSAPPRAEGGRGAALAMVLCAAAVIAVGVYPGPLLEESTAASRAARGEPAIMLDQGVVATARANDPRDD